MQKTNYTDFTGNHEEQALKSFYYCLYGLLLKYKLIIEMYQKAGVNAENKTRNFPNFF